MNLADLEKAAFPSTLYVEEPYIFIEDNISKMEEVE